MISTHEHCECYLGLIKTTKDLRELVHALADDVSAILPLSSQGASILRRLINAVAVLPEDTEDSSTVRPPSPPPDPVNYPLPLTPTSTRAPSVVWHDATDYPLLQVAITAPSLVTENEYGDDISSVFELEWSDTDEEHEEYVPPPPSEWFAPDIPRRIDHNPRFLPEIYPSSVTYCLVLRLQDDSTGNYDWLNQTRAIYMKNAVLPAHISVEPIFSLHRADLPRVLAQLRDVAKVTTPIQFTCTPMDPYTPWGDTCVAIPVDGGEALDNLLAQFSKSVLSHITPQA